MTMAMARDPSSIITTVDQSCISYSLPKKLTMEVQIISKEIIKPSTSTPHSLRTCKLSILDQFAPHMYVPIVLFYSSTSENSCKKSNHLKESFSKTLTHFYPLAGRMKDGSSVDCNDEGATYIEAHVACEMSIVLQQPDIYQLQKLLPCNPYEKLPELSSQVLLATQVNRFDCGGVAIGVCIWHGVADASSLATFVKSWAATACSANENIDGVILDCSSLFPPRDLLSFSLSEVVKEEKMSKSVTKRFVFDGSKIAALKGKIGNIGQRSDCPTRFEAVSSLILGAVMAVEENESMKLDGALISVDLRKRMNPPLPEQAIGNICQATIANWPTGQELDYNGLAGKLHEATRMMNNDYVRQLHSGDAYFNLMRKAFEEESSGNPNNWRMFGLSSWFRFPFYEADFGWGKPIWVGNAIFLSTKDGEGIEAWVDLSKEDMVKFQKNPDILAYASFNPSISYV